MGTLVRLAILLAVWVAFSSAAPETEINLLFEGMVPTPAPCVGGNCGSVDNESDGDCSWIDYDELRDVLSQAVCGSNWPCGSGFPGAVGANGGFNLNMWGAVVNSAGRVCQVVYTGPTNTDQWPASRVIAIQKAVTANSLSLDALALSSANLYAAVQPGGTLFGLQESNPVNPAVAYGGLSTNYGTDCTEEVFDPSCYKKVGGINVFGGGLALYDTLGILGGLGVSGDSSCADHNIAWKVRHLLELDYVTGGVTSYYDNIVYPATPGGPLPAWGHPICSPASVTVAALFNETYPISVATRKKEVAIAAPASDLSSHQSHDLMKRELRERELSAKEKRELKEKERKHEQEEKEKEKEKRQARKEKLIAKKKAKAQ